MRLHEDKRLFRQAVIATAHSLQIPEIYIEKDYWVTYALRGIFSDPVGAQTIFKGGTSLSKCYGLIERFSEDIDLVVTRDAAESGNQIKTKLKRIGAAVSRHLPEIEMSGLTRRRGMNRKTVHGYPQAFAGSPGQVRAILEIYDHQCAACGLRIRLPAGADVSFIDDPHLHASKTLRSQVSALIPPNAPSPDHRWQVSPVVDARRSNGEKELSELIGKTLLLPKDPAFH